MTYRLPAALLALSILAAGCAGLSATPPATQAAKPIAPRSYYDNIAIDGRLSVRYQQNGRDEAVHGSFTWTQQPGHTDIALLSPLGQTLALINVRPSSSTLTQAGQPPKSAADVDALAADTLGWPLPVSGLRDWLQGFITDARGKRIAIAQQEEATETTTDDGWQIRYAAWEADPADPGAMRPRRIDLRRQTMEAGEVALRLVIDNWQAR
jgi:outer membrane lipoprotein LolB